MWLLLAAALFALPAAAVAGTDAGGPNARIVSVGAAVTETLFALGVGDRIVGVDTTSELPPDKSAIARVGYLRTLGAEGLLSLSPTLVILSDEAGPTAVLEQVRATGIPCEVVASMGASAHGSPHAASPHGGSPHGSAPQGASPHGSSPHGDSPHADSPHAASPHGTSPHGDSAGAAAPPSAEAQAISAATTTIRRIAALVDEQARGEKLVNDFESDFASASRGVATRADRPAALFVVHPPRAGSALVAGTGTPADVMLTLAGANNVAGEIRGYRPLTPEAAVASAPEVIIVPIGTLAAAGGAKPFLEAAGLGLTPAGRSGRVVEIQPWMLSFGPRTGRAVADLSDLLHGEVGANASE